MPKARELVFSPGSVLKGLARGGVSLSSRSREEGEDLLWGNLLSL